MRAEDLRKSILQQAIQGKLVKQNPADDPASVLLEHIKAEKDRLVAEGKIKRDKNASNIFKGDDGRYYEKIGKAAPVDITDELPFEIPDGWTWVRIRTIANLYTGNSISDIDKKKKYAIKDGYNFVATKDVGFDYIIRYDESIHIPVDTDFRIAPANKTLLCIEGGSAGRKIAMTKDAVCFGNKLACFDTYWPIDQFLYYYIQSPELQKIFKESISGMIGGVSINKLKEFYLPLPPLAEQERIVKRIEELMPLVDEYAHLETIDKALDDKLPTALKQSILQYAIQGKLVEQDVSDEPASVLLERIKAEKEQLIREGKLRRDKNESYIFKGDDGRYYEKIGKATPVDITDELPFEIPESWQWTRLRGISIIQEGAGIRTFQYREAGIQLLTVTNILEGSVDLDKSKKYIDISEFDSKYKHLKLNRGDIVSACSGGSWGKTAIFNCENVAMLNTSTLRLRFFGDIGNNMFLYYITKSNIFKKQLAEQLSGMQPNFGYSHYSKILIPFPPLAEQKRIVEKLDEIIAKL